MLRRLFVLGLTYLLTTIVAAAQPAPEDKSSLSKEPGVHFILLMDESGDMNGRERDLLVSALPDLLFRGSFAGQQVQPALPRYQPGRDQISAVYFSILKNDNGGCKAGRAKMSALPKDMFSFEGELNIRDENELKNKLGPSWNQPCRYPGYYSPIASAPILVLPYLQQHLTPDRLYSRTILIIATNNLFNTRISPSIELDTFRRYEVTGTGPASQLAYEVSRLFYFNVTPGWNIEVLPNQAYFMLSEVTPLPSPDSALSHQRSINLDQQAISSDKLRVAPELPRSGDLWVWSKGADADYNFLPLSLDMRFRDANGGAWRIGQKTLPETISIDLHDCQSPRCLKDDDKIAIPLFEAASEHLTISSNDPQPGAGRLNFDVGLRYKNKLFDHIFVKSSEQSIDLSPTPPATVSRFFFLLPNITLDNRELANQWSKDADGVTTREEAANRIRGRQKWYQLITLLAIIVFIGYLFLYHYRRRFKPRLEWQPSSEVVVDFNRPAASRLLVGALKIVNEGTLPWLGRFLRNKEQPTRRALLSVGYNFFAESGLVVSDGNPIGFVRAQADEEKPNALDIHTAEAVSDGKQVYLFLAADTIRDYLPRDSAPVADGNDFQIPLSVQMNWRSHDSATSGGASVFKRVRAWLGRNDEGDTSAEIACPLIVKPEDQRKPVVTFQPADEPRLYFSQGSEVSVGKFIFQSQSEHHYAQPFEWGAYTIEAYRDNRPLSGQPIRLGKPRVTVPPYALVEVPVYLVCDGEIVPNPDGEDTVSSPDAINDIYDFKLVGDFHADSKPGFYPVALYRDPTVAEVELTFLYPEKREVFWTKDGTARQRLLLEDGRSAEERELEEATIRLDPRNIEFEEGTERTPDLLTVRIGNSGTSGRGIVGVTMSMDVACNNVTEASIRMASNRPLKDLLSVYLDDEEDKGIVLVKEGDSPETRDIRIQPGLISKIQGAIVPAEKFAALINLDILIRDDLNRERHRVLKIVIPLKLEQLPSSNWLCIDFGTSAIAAAFGTGREGGITLLPLQDISLPGGLSFSGYDTENAEQKSRHLLPSWVVCDADIRPDRGAICRPGFPAYFSKNLTLTPGEPDFVGLPATGKQIEQQPERIIYSLKSWLATTSRSIRLGAKVRYRENGREVESDTLPLKDAVESGLAALAEAYLLVSPTYRADRIVICHPNTFTQRHRDLLHEIAFKVFAPPDRLGIPLKERVQLLSESDAVAFYYCRKQKRDRPRSGAERILVYDFGAGTLDLSLINVEWKMKSDGSCDPVSWDIEGQLGVPVAGNYIDELLARIIDELLNDRALEGRSSIEYQFPVVKPRSFTPETGEDVFLRYHRAIIRLWGRIREAKHEWDGESPLSIKVAAAAGGLDIVKLRPDLPKEEKLPVLPPLDRGEAGLWTDDNYIYLTIPAELIHENKRMDNFVNFVSEAVIDELCSAANIALEKIDTLIISGRGALWPGLRERVGSRFPQATEKPDLIKDRAMKDAVVRGAIARQDMAIEVNDKRWKPKLGVLKNYDEHLVLEDDWDKPIDLFGSPTFKLVQVNLRHPKPLEDMKPGSLRRHFYISLTEEIRRDGEWARTNELFVKRDVREGGKLAIYLEDRRGHQRISVFAQPRAAEVKTDLPWPMGPNYILEPEEEHYQENNGNDQTHGWQ